MNSMTNLMVRETTQALDVLSTNERVRVVVLTGAGKHFCPGADLQGVTTGSGSDAVLTVDDFRTPVLLREMPAVTIALVNGACAGAGFGWALACDLRVATRSAKFNSAFLDVGVAGDMSGPWTLPRLVGAAKARELYFIPDKFTADEAHRIGLVARVFDDETFAVEASAVVDSAGRRRPAGAADDEGQLPGGRAGQPGRVRPDREPAAHGSVQAPRHPRGVPRPGGEATSCLVQLTPTTGLGALQRVAVGSGT